MKKLKNDLQKRGLLRGPYPILFALTSIATFYFFGQLILADRLSFSSNQILVTLALTEALAFLIFWKAHHGNSERKLFNGIVLGILSVVLIYFDVISINTMISATPKSSGVWAQSENGFMLFHGYEYIPSPGSQRHGDWVMAVLSMIIVTGWFLTGGLRHHWVGYVSGLIATFLTTGLILFLKGDIPLANHSEFWSSINFSLIILLVAWIVSNFMRIKPSQ